MSNTKIVNLVVDFAFVVTWIAVVVLPFRQWSDDPARTFSEVRDALLKG
jgi:hypothetical protein